MDINDAIRILDPETTADALAEIEYYAGFSGYLAKVEACDEACKIAVAVMRAQQKTESTEVLQKNELHHMIDQPVWFVPIGEVSSDCKEGWAIWDGEYIFRRSISREPRMYMFRHEDYNERWIAYSKPLTETR